MSKNDGRHGTFEEGLERCMSRGRGSTTDMFIRDVRRSGRWFPERGCILEHQIFSFAKMILRDTCSTSYDLASLFRGRRNTSETWTGKIAKALVRGRQLCTQLSIIEGGLAELLRFWCCQLQKPRTSRRIASFLILPNFKNRGSLAESLRFWCSQLQKSRKSRRITSFLMFPTSKIEEVSQNHFVFDVTKFKSLGSLAESLRFWRYQVQKLRKYHRIASFSSLQIDRYIDR